MSLAQQIVEIVEQMPEKKQSLVFEFIKTIISSDNTDNKKTGYETVQLTENGYTPAFEAELLAAAEECYEAVANGTAKLYSNVAELFSDLDAEEDDE